ncbi:4,5-dihydroxyphthalate decarboxylase [Brevirhabdus pacifica]|uniref:4,5-dihydroxyphthalate decarboxylase n=1 Tax=Brevirhabdus pacifica TaxID=1267768 RepID=A0A1U7DFS3_9RHOB|nr:4,5-dihydroxyphthalate decarboxylase [Brevirhabdus pacifica]APX88749.1 4,5-dihydroxyphthalate decarboxylase [Brevirhabdus pacifica]OWU80004.1 4,5-dihydroxyphthalate decarboxylase [Loktanella sp. 22II-4b]PJJ86730.1 4,5-dihydroxyphthalate decarboxylase [Brevirhabdus pacifica]
MLNLSLATWDHDRVMALHDGRVTVPGVSFESHVEPTSKLFPLAVQEARYDVTELSVSSYALQVSRGECEYTAIPAFISRAFRHSGFFGRRGSGVESPADLAGRRVGVPEYQMTAALWMRGILADEYGVDNSAIHWRTGALDAGVRRERLELALPPGMVVEPITEGDTLQDMLLRGEIDGLLAPKPPRAFLDGNPDLVRLLPDFAEQERAYHQRTGFFPLMHLVAVRKSIVEEHPWLPRALYDGFVAARDLALKRLEDVWLGNANRLSLPWLNETMEKTRAAMGPDFWRYGFAANRAELDAVCRYSFDQHLAARRLAPEDLIHPSMQES